MTQAVCCEAITPVCCP